MVANFGVKTYQKIPSPTSNNNQHIVDFFGALLRTLAVYKYEMPPGIEAMD